MVLVEMKVSVDGDGDASWFVMVMERVRKW